MGTGLFHTTITGRRDVARLRRDLSTLSASPVSACNAPLCQHTWCCRVLVLMKRAAVAELKRTAAAEVKVEEAKRAAAAAAEVEDTDEQGYFERISTFQGRNAEFVQTAASAVGAQENGQP